MTNGNIKTVYRKRGKDDSGNVLGTAAIMDMMTYTYIAGSNKVEKISDAVTTGWANRYSHFIDGANVATEYTYDPSGRVISDLNKGVNYNYTLYGQVNNATMSGNTITFIWDAAGRKHAKIMPGGTTVNYMGAMEYTNDVLISFVFLPME